jgi:hypothetical protein
MLSTIRVGAQCAGRARRNNSTPPMAGSCRRDRPSRCRHFGLPAAARKFRNGVWSVRHPESLPHRWTTGDGAGAHPYLASSGGSVSASSAIPAYIRTPEPLTGLYDRLWRSMIWRPPFTRTIHHYICATIFELTT